MYDLFKNVEQYNLQIENKSITYFYYSDRLFFIYEIERGESVDKYFDFQTEISKPDRQDEIIKKLKLTSVDTNNIYSHIDAFLWDLYLIIIQNTPNEEDFISPEKINEIQRDKFVARKIIVQGVSNETIESKLKDLVLNGEALSSCIDSIQFVFNNDETELLKNIVESDDRIAEQEIKEKLSVTDDLDLEDINKYLDVLKSEYVNKEA